MAITRANAVTRVQAYTGRTDKDSLIQTLFMDFIDNAGRDHIYPEMVVLDTGLATVASTQTLALPAGHYKTLEVKLIQTDAVSYVLHSVPQRWAHERFPNPADYQEAKPTYYYELGSNIYFLPIPDDAYTIHMRYAKLLSGSFDNDAETFPIPTLETAAIQWVTSELFASLEQFENANQWMQRAMYSWDKAKRDANFIPSQRLKAEEFRVFSTPAPNGPDRYINPPEFYLDPFYKGE